MTIEEIDSALNRLRGAAESISANLLEIELDPDRKLLDATALTGESATRWAQASATLTQLWQWYALLDALLDRAAGLRGARTRLATNQLTELSELLDGASIELSNEQVPLEQRDLLGGSGAARRCTPEELLTRMSVAFDESKTVVAAIGKAWETFTPRLHGARETLDGNAELASALGEREPRELDLARRRLSKLTDALSKNPLSVSAGDIEPLEASLQSIRRDLSSLEEVRHEITQLLGDAHNLLEELRRTARDGREASQEVLIKIAAPTVPEPLSLDSTLEAQLEDVAEISRSGAWREARAALEQWTTRVRSLLEDARRIAVENRAPIETRNQLRGLLDAYQAKARRLGLIEDLELSGMFDEARAVLYTAPSDLARAAELLRCYQRTLGENPPAREVLR
jgi:hypothetical protein